MRPPININAQIGFSPPGLPPNLNREERFKGIGRGYMERLQGLLHERTFPEETSLPRASVKTLWDSGARDKAEGLIKFIYKGLILKASERSEDPHLKKEH